MGPSDPVREPLGIEGQDVEVPSHICLFYYDDTELRQRLSFLRLGLDDPSQAVVLFGPRARLEQVLGYIAEDLGRDAADDVRAGRIVLVEGAPDVPGTLGNIAGALDVLVARGVRVVRFLGFIGWGEPDWPGEEELLRFEAQVNDAVTRYPAIVICTYHTNALSGPLLLGGMETHPLTIIGTTVHDNPHYVPPAEYLASGPERFPWTNERRGPRGG